MNTTIANLAILKFTKNGVPTLYTMKFMIVQRNIFYIFFYKYWWADDGGRLNTNHDACFDTYHFFRNGLKKIDSLVILKWLKHFYYIQTR